MKGPATKLAAILLLIPILLITYRVVWLGYPLFPTAPGETWNLSFEARLMATSDGIQIEVGLPQESDSRKILSEQTVSGLLDLDLIRDPPNRYGVWSAPLEKGEAFIAYRVNLLLRPSEQTSDDEPSLEEYPPEISEEEQELAERLVGKWRDLPLPQRLRAVTEAAYGNWEKTRPRQQDLEAWLAVEEKHKPMVALLLLLRSAKIPARAVQGLRLENRVTDEPLTWLQAWSGGKWANIDLATGQTYQNTRALLPLSIGRPEIVLAAGTISQIRWDVRRTVTSTWLLHFDQIKKSSEWLNRLSLFHLPPEFQATFRVLLLVPISALLVCIFRNMVGFPVFGIFMPVLMALAFRSTGLAYGLGIFAFVILIGYLFRRGVNNLRLLLVPRLSVLLSIVIFSITIFAVVGSLYNIREFMAVGLLPIVILTMTIERFFIIVEESGVQEAIRTALGTATVATVSYGILLWEPLQLTFFVYPELIFAVAAFQLLIGRYTGLRLSELGRFRALRGT